MPSGFSPLKWLAVITGFAVLAGVTGTVWNRRFEHQPARALVRVTDGAGDGFSVTKAPNTAPVAGVVGLPFGGPVDALYLRFDHRAVDLERGAEKWQDGRLTLDWVDPSGRTVAHDSLVTMQGSDKKTRSAEMVVRSGNPGSVPVLRVEHLGSSGRMEIRSLQAVAVRERGWVRWGALGLLGGWGLWCYGFARMFSGASRIRVAGVAAILLAMGWFLVLPGPWAHEHPLVGNFQVSGTPVSESRALVSAETMKQVDALGEMPTQGSWLMKAKRLLSFLRPLLHALLFAAPAFVMAILCGSRCAWACGLLISCAVEAGQTAFGFGFDWVDVVDLLVDWTGIALAVWVYGRKVKPRRES